MTKRRLYFEIFNLVFACLEFIAIYFLLMFISGGNQLLSLIIIFIVIVICFINLMKFKSIKIIDDIYNEEYEYIVTELKAIAKDLECDIFIIIIHNPILNAAMYTVKNLIFINADYIQYYDENFSFDFNTLKGIFLHEIGHFKSGISRGVLQNLRLSSYIVGYTRLKLNQMDIKEKKNFFYYLNMVVFFIFSSINLVFLFLRNDEYFANNYSKSIHLLNDYRDLVSTYSKPSHKIYHPSVKKMINKMEKRFKKYDDSEIYYFEETLSYAKNDENLKKLEELALKDNPNALYETGINLIEGNYDISIDEDLGLNRIRKAYSLGHNRALKYLIYKKDFDYIDPERLAISSEINIEDLKKRDLMELVYLDNFESFQEDNNQDISILFNGYKSGNFLAVSLYISCLLELHEFPIEALLAYIKISAVYPDLNFKKNIWYEDLDFIKKVIDLEHDKRNSFDDYYQAFYERLVLDLQTENQYLWRFTVYLYYNDFYKESIVRLVNNFYHEYKEKLDSIEYDFVVNMIEEIIEA